MRKTKLRFGMKTLFLSFVMVIVVVGMASVKHRYCLSINRLLDNQAEVEFYRKNEFWLDELLGTWRFDDVESIYICSSQFLDHDFSNFNKLSKFESDLCRTQELNFLTNSRDTLEELRLCELTEEQGHILSKLPKLKLLQVDCGFVDCRNLEECRGLETLLLGNGTKVENLKKLNGFRSLKQLRLNAKSVDNETISAVESLTSLELLDLSETSVTSGKTLRELVNLRILDISNTQICSELALENLTSLQVLDCTNVKLSKLPSMLHLDKLQILIVDVSEIDCPKFEKLPELSGMKIYGLTGDFDFSRLPKLEKLFLVNSRLSDLDFLSKLPALTTLHLTNTEVEGGLEKIQTLFPKLSLVIAN